MSHNDLHKETASLIHSYDELIRANTKASKKQHFLDLYHQQYQQNPTYKRYCDLLGNTEILDIEQIPAIPTDSFKHALNPTSILPAEINTTFLTSGTTTETKGSHHFSTTTTYETSIIAGWKYCQLPKLHQTFILTPSAKEAPHSSLSHMMETLKREFSPTAEFVLKDGKLNHRAITEYAHEGKPITLLGTALAFLQLFETLPSPLSLAPGSWALETGGYKGTDKSLTKEELYHLFQTHLGIPSEMIWNEYSMTELSSQFYTSGLGNPHIAPPWTHIKVIDPETNRPVKPGEIGYLVIYDLANIDSVMAIRTQDLAIFHDERSFTLIGRDPSALPRGCSRSV